MNIPLIFFKTIMIILASLGTIFHIMSFTNPQSGKKMEQSLGVEFGLEKKFSSKLESNRFGFHNWLVRSRLYNAAAAISLIVVIALVVKL